LLISDFDVESFTAVNAFGGKIQTQTSGSTTQKGKENKLQVQKLGEQKLKDMEAMEKEREDNIIIFTVETYWKYVIQNPRPYDIVMLYNVNAESESSCPHCEEVQAEYTQTVFSFMKDRASRDDSESEKKIFFGVLYF
jgi:hypothetical protein